MFSPFIQVKLIISFFQLVTNLVFVIDVPW
jgi:hypothetical protein